jgi:hypothetical protein
MITSNRKFHRGLGFDLWTNRGAWFWQLAGRYCGAGTIGSALTENEALREAYAAVEELSARCARTASGRLSSLCLDEGGFAAENAANSADKPACDRGDG